MLGLKAKIVSGRTRLSSGFYSTTSGTNVSSRIIRRCIRGGSALLHRANHRLYSSKSSGGGGVPPPDSFGGPDVPLHRESLVARPRRVRDVWLNTLRRAERLANAWRQTPTKWYPLPIAVGALLLIAIQYRKRLGEKEVYVDENGHEVVKLKGPWAVRVSHSLWLRVIVTELLR